ncbi:MAG: hypothetical protein QOH43_4991 [Solirubrobacteraceae bacterium]|jgi:uncharacterized protein YkwD|nr:hypothetical protein [Solirubrobacteraceae bacterium]
MPVAVPVTTAAAAPVADRAERAIVRQLNRERHRFGLRALRLTRSLNRAATSHSRLILRTNQLTHDGTNGTPFAARIKRSVHFGLVGETLAWMPRGSGTGARTVVALWMRSPAHRATLLDPRYRRIGVGRLRGAMGSVGGVAVTADFGTLR